MSIRDLFRREAQRFLLPDEEIQAVMMAITIPPWRTYIFPPVLTLTDSRRAIVFTNRRVLLCRMAVQRSLATILDEVRSLLVGPAVLSIQPRQATT